MTPQTVSLGVAKKLNKMGFKKESMCVYWTSPDSYEEPFHYEICYRGEENFYENEHCINAYQLHEILHELPYMITYGTANLFLKIDKFEDDYIVGYYEFSEYPWGEQKNENPHDAAALLWIWCVEQNYITL